MNYSSILKKYVTTSFIIKDGKFFRAYDTLAKMISKVSGYRLMHAHSRNLKRLCYVGIPYSKIEFIIAKLLAEYGDKIEYSIYSEELYLVHFKENIVVKDVEVKEETVGDLKQYVNSLDIERLSPIEAFKELLELKKLINNGANQ